MAKPRRPDGGSSGGPPSIAAAQESILRMLQRGRAKGGERPAAGSGGRDAGLVTQATGMAGGVPDGRPTRVPARAEADYRRSLEGENAAAAHLADRGYRIKQNPTPDEVAQARAATGDSGKARARPDYLLEGRVFDAYSPRPNKGVRGIWSEVGEKVADQQTQRVVVNLEGWNGDMAALRRQFDDWPMEGLKEVKVIAPNGDIVQIVPND